MIGKVVSHYKILEKLGEGGTGVVYKALDEKLNRIVALKFFHDQPFTNEEQKAFLTREAQAAAALNHPNIRTIYEIDETDECFFMSMAFIEGASLKKKLLDGPLNPETAVSIAYQVADGLNTAHNNGIIHRNLNSANILITDRGLAKILNFGLASPSTETGPTIKSASINTTAYLSPEQLRYEKIDQRTDIWSWGVVFYEMLTGKLPFKGERSAGFDRRHTQRYTSSFHQRSISRFRSSWIESLPGHWPKRCRTDIRISLKYCPNFNHLRSAWESPNRSRIFRETVAAFHCRAGLRGYEPCQRSGVFL